MKLVEHFELFLERLGSYKCSLILCGDLNNNTRKTNVLTGKCLEIFESIGCMTLNKDATHVTNLSSTCIDHMIIGNTEK